METEYPWDSFLDYLDRRFMSIYPYDTFPTIQEGGREVFTWRFEFHTNERNRADAVLLNCQCPYSEICIESNCGRDIIRDDFYVFGQAGP